MSNVINIYEYIKNIDKDTFIMKIKDFEEYTLKNSLSKTNSYEEFIKDLEVSVLDISNFSEKIAKLEADKILKLFDENIIFDFIKENTVEFSNFKEFKNLDRLEQIIDILFYGSKLNDEKQVVKFSDRITIDINEVKYKELLLKYPWIKDKYNRELKEITKTMGKFIAELLTTNDEIFIPSVDKDLVEYIEKNKNIELSVIEIYIMIYDILSSKINCKVLVNEIEKSLRKKLQDKDIIVSKLLNNGTFVSKNT